MNAIIDFVFLKSRELADSMDEIVKLYDRMPPWVGLLVLALVAVLVGLIVHRVVGMILMRATRRTPVIHAVTTNCQNAARLVLPLILLQIVWAGAPDKLAHIDAVRHLNGLSLIAAFTWLMISAINGVAAGIIAEHPSNVVDNLNARRIHTQATVLARTAIFVVLIAGASLALMTFPGAKQVGASLLASAGVIGIVAGLAAKPVFSNIIAGLQIALAQPIRIDDVLIVQGEWGKVEEITGTYVVLKIWDERRLIIPLQWFIENPFQNWTRTSAELLGTVFLNVDFTLPIAPFRAELERVVPTFHEWDKRVCHLQVTDTTEYTMQLRILVTAASSPLAFDLRCKVREAMIDFVQREYPQCLPKRRMDASLENAYSQQPELPHELRNNGPQFDGSPHAQPKGSMPKAEATAPGIGDGKGPENTGNPSGNSAGLPPSNEVSSKVK